jgi:DNA polymerase III alpha subunit (gram-positive type)
MKDLGESLLRYHTKEKKILVCDCETNGLNLKYTLPFNISFNIYQNNQLIEEHDLYLKWPNYQIKTELAIKVHYNKEKIEKEGKEPKEVFELLNKYLNNKEYLIVGSNWLNYDCMVIENSAKSIGVNIGYKYLNKVYDCNSLFKAYKLNKPIDYENFLAYQWSLNAWVQKGLKSRVGIACKEFGIEYNDDDAHSGSYDVSRSYLIFMELIKRMEIK